VALTVAFALAGFVVVLAIVELLSTPVQVGPPFNFTEDQHAESALYLVAVAIMIPGSLFVTPKLADRLAAGPGSAALSSLAAAAVASLLATLLVVRVLPGGGGVVEALVAMLAWIGLAAWAFRRALKRSWPALARWDRHAPGLWALAAASLIALLLAFTDLRSISVPALAVGAALVIVVLRGLARGGTRLGGVDLGRWGFAIDAGVLILLALAIPDLVIFRPEDAATNQPDGLSTIISFHHGLWLGPTNEVLSGRPLLVDTASQYGVGPIYLLAAWFHIAPIGFGTLGFLDGVSFALAFCAAYALLRIAGVSRLIAAAAIGVGVVVLVYNLVFSVGSLPQHGPIRFGLPLLLILASTIEARDRRGARIAGVAQLAVVGLATIWSLEALVYTLATYAAIVGLKASFSPPGGRLRWMLRRALAALGACVLAIVLLSVLTLVLTGSAPDFGPYLSYLHAFLSGPVSELTYDFAPWSAGLAVGGAYLVSAAAIVLLVLRRPEVARGQATTMIALAGCTAYGVALFSYFVDRSLDHVLPYVSLPLLLCVALWLTLLIPGALTRSRQLQLGGLAVALSATVLLVAVAFSSIAVRFPRSALGYLVPGGASVEAGLHRLWHPPPLDPSAPAGEALLNHYMPDQSRVLILAPPDLSIEILIRSGRSNQLPFTDPLEDSFVDEPSSAELRDAVASIRPGERVLMQRGGLDVIAALRSDPSRALTGNLSTGANALTPQQREAIALIARRFDLRLLVNNPNGFVVAQLQARRAGR
jgi:hypothetical protein